MNRKRIRQLYRLNGLQLRIWVPRRKHLAALHHGLHLRLRDGQGRPPGLGALSDVLHPGETAPGA